MKRHYKGIERQIYRSFICDSNFTDDKFHCKISQPEGIERTIHMYIILISLPLYIFESDILTDIQKTNKKVHGVKAPTIFGTMCFIIQMNSSYVNIETGKTMQKFQYLSWLQNL